MLRKICVWIDDHIPELLLAVVLAACLVMASGIIWDFIREAGR